ncbi:MAG: fibronectin type III domain-containing protein, partial [Egibacteraceae bacterium]
VTVNQAGTQADPTSSTPILFTVVFNEAVTGFATGDVTLGGTAPGTLTGTVTEIAPNNGTTYTVAVSGMTGSGTVTASLNAGVATDTAGNGNAASTSTDNSVTFDSAAPTVASINRATASPTNAASVQWTVTFSKSVSGVDAGDFVLAPTGVTGAAISSVSGGPSVYTVTVGTGTGNGTIRLDIPATATITDLVNNALAGLPFTTGQVYTIDKTAPTVPGSLSATAAGSSQIKLSWTASTDTVGVTGSLLERCRGAGCSSFTQITTPTGTTYSNTGLQASTSYSYRVRATDADGNLSGYSNPATATTPAPPAGLVAAYAFNEGTGTTVADASGNGNTGTINGATRTTAGQFGGALVFNGTSARVDVPDALSLDLTTGMTLAAWVYPTVAATAWRDVIFKAVDMYYLEASSDNGGRPGAGGTFASPLYGTAQLPTNTWTHLA